jgi:hypothetical protein
MKRTLGRIARRWENIKMEHKETGRDDVEGIHFTSVEGRCEHVKELSNSKKAG